MGGSLTFLCGPVRVILYSEHALAMERSVFRILGAAFLGAVFVIGMGCDEKNGLYPVQGTVLYKGEPASGAAVRFVHHGPSHSGEPCTEGIVQKDGSFSLTTAQIGAGAAPGTYDVFVEWRDGPPVLTKLRGRKPDNRPLDRLHGQYADPKKPRLHAEVKAETNRLPPFEITDPLPGKLTH
jgi:hypothetical protein